MVSLDSAQLATFQVVIDEGSFEAAAGVLHVTPSAVSQRIKALEQAVGQVLVRRSKPAEPTEAGRSVYRLAGQVSLLEREALDAARGQLVVGGRARTRVAVVANADSVLTWFLPALTGLPADLGLCFDLHEDDQDHTAELLRSGSAMAAVTAQRVPVQGCRVEPLGAMRYLAVASAGLRDRYFSDGVRSGLHTAPMIVFNRKDRLQHRFLAAVTGRRADPPIHHIPSAWGFYQTIRQGLGWGMVPEQIARDDIAAGRCVDLVAGRHLDVPLYWQYWRLESTALTALTTAVRAAAASALR